MQTRTASRERLSAAEWAAIAGALIVTFTAHAIYGANTDARALVLVTADGVLLLGLLCLPQLRAALVARQRVLILPGLLLALTILIGLRPLIPGFGGTASTTSAVLESVKLLGLACAFVAGVALGGRDERARRFLFLWIWMGGLYAAACINVFKVAPTTLGLGQKTLFLDRLTATFISPNSAATLLGMTVVLGVAAALETKRGAADGKRGPSPTAAISLAAAGAAFVALVLTASRAGLMSTLAALVALAVAHAVVNREKLNTRAVLATLGGAIVVGGAIGLGGQLVLGRLVNLNSADRVAILHAHWGAFLQHPWLGWGLGSFDAINKALMTPDSYRYLWNIRAAHNVYVQWLEEVGVVGALPMFAAVAVVLGVIAQGMGVRRSMRSWLRGVLALSLVVLLHGLSDYALQTPSIANAWAMILGVGLAVATGKRPKGIRKSEPETDGLLLTLKKNVPTAPA